MMIAKSQRQSRVRVFRLEGLGPHQEDLGQGPSPKRSARSLAEDLDRIGRSLGRKRTARGLGGQSLGERRKVGVEAVARSGAGVRDEVEVGKRAGAGVRNEVEVGKRAGAGRRAEARVERKVEARVEGKAEAKARRGAEAEVERKMRRRTERSRQAEIDVKAATEAVAVTRGVSPNPRAVARSGAVVERNLLRAAAAAEGKNRRPMQMARD